MKNPIRKHWSACKALRKCPLEPNSSRSLCYQATLSKHLYFIFFLSFENQNEQSGRRGRVGLWGHASRQRHDDRPGTGKAVSFYNLKGKNNVVRVHAKQYREKNRYYNQQFSTFW